MISKYPCPYCGHPKKPASNIGNEYNPATGTVTCSECGHEYGADGQPKLHPTDERRPVKTKKAVKKTEVVKDRTADIDEVRRMIESLESALSAGLDDFAEKTGCRVTAIEFDRRHVMDADRTLVPTGRHIVRIGVAL